VKYFYIECYYLDFNRKVFSDVSTALRIKKFREIMRIYFFGVFSFLYYQKEKEIRAYLDRYDRKFLKLINVHYCQY
jgi:hypothetical protein